MKFNPKSITTFRFVRYAWNDRSRTACFDYALDDAFYFTEELIFPEAMIPQDKEGRMALENCLAHLHLVLGISYYKTAVPGKIVMENQSIPASTAFFLQKLYLHGLAEFSYRNGLDLHDKIRFPFSAQEAQPSNLVLPQKTAVPVGGGKDSIVTIEILKQAREPMILFSLGNFPAIENVSACAGIPKITVIRKLPHLLFELNSQGAYNGHVPISAIIAFTLATASVLYGFDKAVLSNERSANVGNLIHQGMEVNHQYSKSLEFERDVANFLQTHVLKNFQYFSFLRPISELAIAGLFSQYESYHSTFTSCNQAFKFDEKKRVFRWCLDCSKCRFVFLALAPFLEKQKLITIFQANLLDQEKQVPGYEELIGQKGHKPWECVGEIEECLAAFFLLTKTTEWANDLMVRKFRELVLPVVPKPENMVKKAIEFSHKHLLPEHYESILKNHWETLFQKFNLLQ